MAAFIRFPSASYHLSSQPRGLLPNSDHAYSYGATSSISDLNDGEVHSVRILYAEDVLNIFLDGLLNPCLSVNINISDILQLDSGFGWVGFPAGTGSGYENYDILSWSFQEIPEPATMSLLGLGSLIFLKRRQLSYAMKNCRFETVSNLSCAKIHPATKSTDFQ